MILYILIILIAIGGIIMFVKGDKHDRDVLAAIGLLVGLFGISATIGFGISFSFNDSDATAMIENRDYYQELVLGVNDEMSFQTVSKIIGQAESYNRRIENNRKNCDNIFYGWFYNKKIAAIEPIKIPDIRIKGFGKYEWGF